MSDEVMVTKVTCSTGKVVLLREVKIKHTELAAQAAAPRANGDPSVLSLMMQKELLKLLVVQINGQDVKASQLEKIDDLLSMREYLELSGVVRQLTGGDDLGKPQTELVSFGSK